MSEAQYALKRARDLALYIVIGFVLVLSFVFLAANASAFTAYWSLDTSYSSGGTPISTRFYVQNDIYVSSLYTYGSCGSVSRIADVRLYDDTGAVIATSTYDCTDQYPLNDWRAFPLSATVQLSGGHWYQLYTHYTGLAISYNGEYVGNFTEDGISCSSLGATSTPPYTCTTSDLAGLAFGFEITYVSGDLSITLPRPESINAEFDFFTLNYTVSDPGEYQIVVVSATSSAAVYTTSTNAQFAQTREVADEGTRSTYAFRGGSVFCPDEVQCPADGTGTRSHWYSRAYIYDDLGTLIGESDLVDYFVIFSFKNVPTAGTTTTLPFASTTDWKLFELLDCGDFDGILASSTASYLICSTRNSILGTANDIAGFFQRLFGKIGDLILKVWPLNMIVHVQSIFTDVERAEPIAGLVMLSPYSTTTTVPLVTSSTLNSVSSSLPFGSFADFFDLIMYAFTGVLLVVGTVLIGLMMTIPK